VAKIIPLPPEVGKMLWDSFRDQLELAVMQHPGEHPEDLDALREEVAKGKLMVVQIFEGVEAVAVALLEFVKLRDGSALHVRYLSGNGMGGWLDELHEKLQEIARAYDCQWISLTGRMGWQKELKRLNWNPVAIQMRAEVTHG
jgi:hypothetical protein